MTTCLKHLHSENTVAMLNTFGSANVHFVDVSASEVHIIFSLHLAGILKKNYWCHSTATVAL